VIDEGRLQPMQLVTAGRALNRHNFGTIIHDCEREAGNDTLPVTRARSVLPTLSPRFIDAGARLTAILGHARVVRIAFRTTTVTGGGVVRVKRRAQAKPFRQIGIGEKLATESDQIGLALRQPLLGRVMVEPAGDDEGSRASD
jgi:hypothetical protein